MPIKEEKQLMASAKKRGLKRGSRSWGAYVYGTLHQIKKKRKKKHGASK